MPETLGLGCDLCAVSRIERAIEKEHFVARVYTEEERAYLVSRGKGRAQSAAAMFAAKEAVAKAMGTGFSGGVMPQQIEVIHDTLGAPGISVSGAAAERLSAMGGKDVLLSLSHEGDMALAVAIIIKG